MTEEKKKIDDGGPAFPVVGLLQGRDPRSYSLHIYDSGLTKREWFAGMALMGMLSNFYRQGFPSTKEDNYAQSAYILADAMIEEGQK